MKFGFLLNHYDVHQVPHVVPYAYELSRRHPEHAVAILTSSPALRKFAAEIGAIYPGHNVELRRLRLPLWLKAAGILFPGYSISGKSKALKANLGLLASFDALVMPELTSSKLKAMAGLERLKMVFTCHGAGDNRGIAPFDGRLRSFDLSLLPGRKYADGLVETGFLEPGRFAISGYPKFEVMAKIGGRRRKFFAGDRPVVLYNPHQQTEFSSWRSFGAEVLDFFVASKRYNLIFAPHVLLFKKDAGLHAGALARARQAPNCLIDTGSRLSADMTYVRSADIYLGDVSSQVYEFLETPRPCVFLDAHETAWRGNPSYRYWTFGPVAGRIADLGPALDRAMADHAAYRRVQERGFRDTFALGEGAAARGADIIHDFFTAGRIDPRHV